MREKMSTPKPFRYVSFVLFSLFVGFAANARAATYTVTNTNDSGAGSLRQAILDANANAGDDEIIIEAMGVITLGSTLHGTNGNVTITGPGASLLTVRRDPAIPINLDPFPIFVINAGHTVSITGITIKSGTGKWYGGGIHNSGNLTLTNVVVTGNRCFDPFGTLARGGGIYNGTGSLTIIDSEISSNTGDTEGGAIFNFSGTVVVSNSRISGNSALAGGGIFNYAGQITVNATTVASNSAAGFGISISREGGGIFNSGTATVNNSTLSGNSAAFRAGGIYNGGTLTVSESTISGNQSSQGGGIRNLWSATINSSTITMNSSTGFGGGGIMNFFDGAPVPVLVLNNTIVANNQAALGDPSIAQVWANVGWVNTGQFNFIGGNPKLRGLGDYGGPTKTHTPYCGSPVIDAGKNLSGVTNDQRGAAFARTVDDPLLSNAADGDGTDIGSVEAQTPPTCSSPPVAVNDFATTIEDTSVSVAVLSNDTDPDNDVLFLVSITQPLHGSATMNPGGTVSYTPSTNYNGTDFMTYSISDGYGGESTATISFTVNAVEDVDETFVVTNTNDSGPGSLRQALLGASANGGVDQIVIEATGVIHLSSTLYGSSGNVTITGPGANLLTVTRGGPAADTNFRIFTFDSGLTASISGITISDGRGVAYGGGIYNVGNLTLTDVVLIGNTCLPPFGGPGVASGGGIYNGAGSLTIIRSQIQGNTGLEGGGIHNSTGTVVINNSRIVGNLGKSGGAGIYNYAGHVTVNTTTIAQGSSGGSGIPPYGAGIYNSGTAIVNNSTISGNVTPVDGGGIYNRGALQVTESTISGNSLINGDAIGGGIRSLGPTRITSSTITNNSSNGFGGGLATYTPGVPDPDLVLNNTIVANNWSRVAGANIYVIALTGQFNFIDGDPKLSSLSDNGGPTQTHLPLPGSPVLDAGKNLSSATSDQRGAGFARTFDDPAVPNASGGDGTDIGAVELSVTNTAPVANADSYSTDEDTSFSANVLGNDTDGENDALSAILVSGPSHASSFTLNPDGSVSYMPEVNFNGNDSFTYKANDGSLDSNETTVSITVNAINDAPAIVGENFSRQINAGSSSSTIAIVNDVDNAAGSLVVTVLSAPPGITVTSITNSDGTVSASVAADCYAALGDNSVQLSVFDGQATATGNLTVNVTATTNPPTITLNAPITVQSNDRKYRTISISQMVASATDDCGNNLIDSVVIEKVTSDEEDDAQGNSDGKTVNDVVIAPDCKTVQLRAEREDKKDGRVYSVTLRASDLFGNVTRATYKVLVPIAKKPVVDSGTAYTVLSSCL